MKTCLIVDDSAVIRKVSRKILTEFQFACDEAENGRKALEACEKRMPDLIMLDWNMPVMSGIEFLPQLRAMPGGHRPHVIFCTTENDFSFIEKALLAGANEYIMKPFDKEIIESKLQQLGLVNV